MQRPPSTNQRADARRSPSHQRADARRSPAKPRRSAKKPPAKLLELIKLQRQKRAIGAKFYGESDKLLKQIIDVLTVGKKVPLGGGVFAVLTDAFSEGDRAFKPVFVNRYELRIVDADGKETRLRDRGRNQRADATPLAKKKRAKKLF